MTERRSYASKKHHRTAKCQQRKPVRPKPCHALLCRATNKAKARTLQRHLAYKVKRTRPTLHPYDTESDPDKIPSSPPQASIGHDEDLRCFPLCGPPLLLVPSLERRSRSKTSVSWLLDRRGDAVGMVSSSSVAAGPAEPSGFNGTSSTLPLPLPLPLAAGCALKSNIPAAWKDTAAAAVAAAFGAGWVCLGVTFSCRRRSTNRDRRSRSTNQS